MRFILTFMVLFYTANSYSWECGDYDNYQQSVEEHYSLASDVIFGRVLSGEVGGDKVYRGDLLIEFDISYSVKGERSGSINLSSSLNPPFPQFVLGGHYLVFLFGDDFISFCSIVNETVVEVRSYDDLVEYSGRKDIGSVSLYENLVVLAKKP